MSPDPDLLTREEAAKYVGLSYSTLSQWHSKGNLNGPPVTKIGGRVRYLRSELDKWIQSRTIRTPADAMRVLKPDSR